MEIFRAAIRRGGKMWVPTARMLVLAAKMVVKTKMGHQASHDFWGRQNFSPPRAPITHTTPLQSSSNEITYELISSASPSKMNSHQALELLFTISCRVFTLLDDQYVVRFSSIRLTVPKTRSVAAEDAGT